MRGSIEYDAEEVEAIVLAHHEKQIPAPAGKYWTCKTRSYAGATLSLEDRAELKSEVQEKPHAIAG